MDAGVPWDHLVVDPGFGFGKTPDHNMALLADLGAAPRARTPDPAGDLAQVDPGQAPGPASRTQRVEATAATTALGIAAGADIVRVHDVRENARTARVADAILRGWRPDGWPGGA